MATTRSETLRRDLAGERVKSSLRRWRIVWASRGAGIGRQRRPRGMKLSPSQGGEYQLGIEIARVSLKSRLLYIALLGRGNRDANIIFLAVTAIVAEQLAALCDVLREAGIARVKSCIAENRRHRRRTCRGARRGNDWLGCMAYLAAIKHAAKMQNLK